VTHTGFDVQYFIPNLLIASFFKIIVHHVCFVKGISIFVEIGALQNFTHFDGHLKNGCQNDRHLTHNKF
jgi:hypothetical protein